MNWDGSDIEPRLKEASFHNPYFSALPLATLHSYRRVARSSDVANVSLGTRMHLNSLVHWPTHNGWPQKYTASRPRGGTGYTYG